MYFSKDCDVPIFMSVHSGRDLFTENNHLCFEEAAEVRCCVIYSVDKASAVVRSKVDLSSQ